MYYDEIVEYKDDPEYGYVRVYCGECKQFYDLELDKEMLELRHRF